ncbi:MAG: hypothetical protein U9Q69_03320 [Nanoarchaeota archaeon]|nr:hypothetical protein [Nanoarchaeota archaeon]
MANRLFVPLCTQPFIDFRDNGKTYELRACKGNFSEKFVYAGRNVELRKGYSGKSIWGKIGNVVIGTLDEVLERINYSLIIPKASSRQEAIAEIESYLGKKPKYIAFEVLIK